MRDALIGIGEAAAEIGVTAADFLGDNLHFLTVHPDRPDCPRMGGERNPGCKAAPGQRPVEEMGRHWAQTGQATATLRLLLFTETCLHHDIPDQAVTLDGRNHVPSRWSAGT